MSKNNRSVKSVGLKGMKYASLLILTLVFTISFVGLVAGEDNKRIAIVPFQINSPENLDYLEGSIFNMLASRLSVDETISVIERTTVLKALGKDKYALLTADDAVALGKRLGADYVVFGSLTKLGETFSLDAKMFDVNKKERSTAVYAQGSGMDSLIPKINEFARNMNFKILGYVPAEGVAGYKGLQAENPNFIFATRDLMSKTDFRKSPFWKIQIKGVDVGDIDGDKMNETVVIDKNDLWIYKRGKEEFELFTKFSGRPVNNFLAIDIMDLNDNGIDEIFITNVSKGRLSSFVVEYNPKAKKLVRIENNIPLFFRMFTLPKRKPMLLAQKMAMDSSFFGPLYRVEYKNGEYVEETALDFPRGTEIYGTTLPVDIDYDGRPELVQIDKFNHLNIVGLDGKEEWATKEYWGGTVNYFNTREKEEKIEKGGDSAELEDGEVYIQTRIFITDLNHDGSYEVLLCKNISETMNLSPKFRLYETSEIYNLSWDGINLSENWQSRLIDGYIADYQLKDVDSDGIDELVVAVVFSFEMTKLVPASSGVLIYELSF
ncbi:MAG: VCBS repeat-containing protein [Deltaproteobacteria bacterium]|uniref:VCBS repeat-containing protein n=1 Tax=Candidatus Zymogenus saltonus TaxID=2844893 RepID=A0A9D8KID6_9DELT|nr:VCBS repeat-containing protein [Candidatus Zymogenus saltonus]